MEMIDLLVPVEEEEEVVEPMMMILQLMLMLSIIVIGLISSQKVINLLAPLI